jgi:class 3 adenylate cyclase
VTRPGPRQSLFRRYLVTHFVVVLVPLLASGASDAWFTARDLRAMLDALLRTEATAAAADLHEALAAAKAEWQARGHAIGFGMGIAAGTATVGRIGYAGRLEYTAIGNVVNLAARLCARAEDGQTLVDRATADAVDRSGELTSLGRTALKGYAETVPIFLHRRPPGGSQLVERRPTRCPTPRSAAATAGVLRS